MLHFCCSSPVRDQERIAPPRPGDESGEAPLEEISTVLLRPDHPPMLVEPTRIEDTRSGGAEVAPSMWDCDLTRLAGLELGFNYEALHPKRLKVTGVPVSRSAVTNYNWGVDPKWQIKRDDVIVEVNGITGTEAMREILDEAKKDEEDTQEYFGVESQAGKELRVRIARPRKSEFTLARGKNDVEKPWGVNVEYISSNGGLVVTGVVEGGLVERHNDAQRSLDTRILVGDTIEAVNGVRSSLAADMASFLKVQATELKVVVVRVVAPYTVYYHTACRGFVGRAFGPLCILEAAGAIYEIKVPDAQLKGAGAFAPPCATLPGGTTIGQTGAMCIAFGRLLGLAPVEEPGFASARRRSLQLTDDIGDFFNDVAQKKGRGRLMKWMHHFDKALGDKPFFMGAMCTFVDYAAVGTFMFCHLKKEHKSPDYEGVYFPPRLAAWFEKMRNFPAVVKVSTMADFLPKQYFN